MLSEFLYFVSRFQIHKRVTNVTKLSELVLTGPSKWKSLPALNGNKQHASEGNSCSNSLGELRLEYSEATCRLQVGGTLKVEEKKNLKDETIEQFLWHNSSSQLMGHVLITTRGYQRLWFMPASSSSSSISSWSFAAWPWWTMKRRRWPEGDCRTKQNGVTLFVFVDQAEPLSPVYCEPNFDGIYCSKKHLPVLPWFLNSIPRDMQWCHLPSYES